MLTIMSLFPFPTPPFRSTSQPHLIETSPESQSSIAFPARLVGQKGFRGVASATGQRQISPGFLTGLNKAMEEEEFRRARAEVHRKGLDVEGYTVEGISVGGHETCVVVPSLNASFDIGRCPSRAVHQDFLFLTHAHLDHIGGLPMYIATRGLYSLNPPTVFVPPCIKEDVEKLLEIHRSMSQVELKVDLVALDVGETYEIRTDLVVRPFRTHHVIPSQGYVIYSVRRKLKKMYAHLRGDKIKNLKLAGVEITDTILSPEVAFTGDTTADFMLEPRNADALRAKVLITEATFLDDGISIEHARQHGHTHLLEIIENAQWIRNKAILLTHFSSRYKIEKLLTMGGEVKPTNIKLEAGAGLWNNLGPDTVELIPGCLHDRESLLQLLPNSWRTTQDIREAVSNLQQRMSAKVFALTEGFRSTYS